MIGGEWEQHELLVLRKGLLLASAWSSEARMTRCQPEGTRTQPPWHCGGWGWGGYWKRRRV